MPLRRGIVSGVALGLAMCVGLAAQTTRGAKHMSVREIQVQRVTLISSEPFDEVVARIDAQIGHTDLVEFRRKLSVARNEAEMKSVVDPVAQPNGIMELARFDLGDILRKESGSNRPRILRIVAGNPLIMKEMVKHVPDAGSYAPITILIDERADGVHISYDTMVSHLAPYGNNDALRVARDLDAKIEKIITAAAK
jgi:uncharacterized protein (DUF302 family)